jgi:hypothetical protein
VAPARKARAASKKTGAAKKKTGAAKKSAASRGPIKRIEAATSATFGVDDKRAQYARLIVFNYAVKTKAATKDKDVNSVSNTVLEKAGKELNGGNMLDGKPGIELIQDLSQKGATDTKVAERGLTTAYAQEVRPFLKRLQFADSFGRRGKKAEEPAEASA